MYNYQKLRGLIIEYFGTLANFAKAINMGTSTLYSKLNCKTYFDQMEIEKIADVLHLKTPEQINTVFFTHK